MLEERAREEASGEPPSGGFTQGQLAAFNTRGTISGRLSSLTPAAQHIPFPQGSRVFTGVDLALAADYASIERRIVSKFAGKRADMVIIDELVNYAEGDADRTDAMIRGFGLLYGDEQEVTVEPTVAPGPRWMPGFVVTELAADTFTKLKEKQDGEARTNARAKTLGVPSNMLGSPGSPRLP
jgi:hypothetical protein